jgi:DNA (cytosine-5)-methyltransferase 1
MRDLVLYGRAPRTIVLENVYGCLTSRGGRDFAAIASALSGADYRFGAVVINAVHFVPQSRPRVFFIAVRDGEVVPAGLIEEGPRRDWHPIAIHKAYSGIAEESKKKWLWWSMPLPPVRNAAFADLIEDDPAGVEWHTAAQTNYLLSLMSPVNRDKVAEAKRSGRRKVGGVYRRTRPDENGAKTQRAEVRFDDNAGCLRTPSGGSSRQTILIVDGQKVRSRLLSSREAARLMGLPDDYRLPARYNDAYHVCGDGVCVPVVRHIAAHILKRLIEVNKSEVFEAAE